MPQNWIKAIVCKDLNVAQRNRHKIKDKSERRVFDQKEQVTELLGRVYRQLHTYRTWEVYTW